MVHWRNNCTAWDLFGRNIPQLLRPTNLPSPQQVFLQTSTELFHILSKSLKKLECTYEQETLPSWINYYTAIGWKIQCGPTEMAAPEACNFRQYFCMFLHNTDASMLSRLFDDRKYNICIYISLYIRNTTILVNKTFVCSCTHQLVNTCDLHLVKCAICSTILAKMPPIGQLSPILEFY